jgi:ABC-type oligopeptide transport system substrate-binding subunit
MTTRFLILRPIALMLALSAALLAACGDQHGSTGARPLSGEGR